MSDATDRYHDLTRQFPLRPIQDDAGLDRATALCHELIGRDLDDDEDDYLSVLDLLIEDYEDRHFPMPDVPEGDMLRHLIESRGTTTEAVADATGIGMAKLTDTMEGNHDPLLTRGEIGRLAKFFKVSPAVFFN